MIDLERFRAGDPGYFQDLLRNRGRVVLGVVRAYAKDPDHVDDLFQESWARVYEKRRSFRGRGSFDGWLHRIATTVCIGDYRARKERSEAMDRITRENMGDQLGWRTLNPQSEEERGDLHGRLQRALAGLTPREMEAVSLRVMEGRKTRDVAEAMRVSPATVRSIIRHGIGRLRKILEELDDEMSGYRSSH